MTFWQWFTIFFSIAFGAGALCLTILNRKKP